MNSRADRGAGRSKEMMSEKKVLPIIEQCRLLGLTRSSCQSVPDSVRDEELFLMKTIDQCYLELPFDGTRRGKD